MLEAPAKGRVSRSAAQENAPRRAPGAPSLRRDLSEDFARGARGDEHHPTMPLRRFKGVRFRLKGGVPQSMVGRVMAGSVLVGMLAAFTAVVWEARSLLLHDDRLVIPSSAAIQITGNRHMTRPQLLTVFGEDVDRNILTVPVAERRAELEQLPWVEHATVMRLLPNRFRVAIAERTPVAFTRQGGKIGLVDANGVLLDMSRAGDGEDAAREEHYSFPVVTGISAEEPASTRAARMKLYMHFMAEMDAGAEKVTTKLSEIDLSNPEDVKALVPNGSSDILVHFGEDDFLHRYEIYAKHLPEWKSANPRLASVDMRYEHQVVLEMSKPAAAEAPVKPVGEHAPVKTVAKLAAKADTAKSPLHAAGKPVVAKPAAKPNAVPGAHLETAFAVHAKSGIAAAHGTQAVPQ